MAQNTTGPVFYPRLYHLMAYVCILMGDGHSCDFFLNTALELSETQGNLLEKCWLSMSKVRTLSQQAAVWGEGGSARPPQWVSRGIRGHCLSSLALPLTVLQAGKSKTMVLECSI